MWNINKIKKLNEYMGKHFGAGKNLVGDDVGYLGFIEKSFMNINNDNINHPKHYTYGDIECIEVTQHMPFLDGNAIKYIWRHRYKNGAEDIKKAIWYLNRILKKEYEND